MIPAKSILMHPIKSNGDIKNNLTAGYIMLYRSIKKHWLWRNNRKKSRFEAWVDLLIRASHADQKEPVGVDLITVKRGQILTSQVQLSKDWSWSRHAVSDFLVMLQKDHMVALKTDTKWSMITISNYDSYQTVRTSKGHQKDINGTSKGHIQELETLKEDSTPPVFLFSHNGFFDRQLSENKNAAEFDNYRVLVEYLHGKNEDDLRFKNVLSLEKQISYHDFVRLKEAAKESGRTIKEVLTAMENRATLARDYKNVYLTAKNWLKSEFKR